MDGVKNLAAVLSKQTAGLTKEERKARLKRLEEIASAVHARRSTPQASQPNAVKTPKDRIHA
jgi:hypothetical protein